MKRSLGWLSLLALIALPNSASAFFPCWWFAPRPYYYAGPPVAYSIPYYSIPYYYVSPYSMPTYTPIYPSTIFYPQSTQQIMPVAMAPRQPLPTKPPSVEVVRPLNATVPIIQPAMASNPAIPKSSESDTAIPSVSAQPKAARNAQQPSTQPLNLIEAVAPTLPAIKLPDLPMSKELAKPAGSSIPFATPSSAPPPNTPMSNDTGLNLPKLPISPDAKPGSSTNESLPPLVLPPESLAPPSGIVPKESISRSSPISSGMSVRVFQNKGEASGSNRRIGFFNHTDRDVALVIEGRSVTLPKRSYIHATVPAEFRWSHSENPIETAKVPEGSAGLDILFRE